MIKEIGQINSNSTSNHIRQISDGEDPVLAIIKSVAAVSGQSATEIDPLSNVIDPDALNAVLGADGNPLLSFGYCGYQVTADTQEVVIEE